jgi:hypothetical protein
MKSLNTVADFPKVYLIYFIVYMNRNTYYRKLQPQKIENVDKM